MSEQQGSSFIPKAGASSVRRTGITRRIYLLSYISYIIFFSVLFATAGIFLYGIFVERSLSDVNDQLVVEQERFSADEVDSIHRLNNRLVTAERLLDGTATPSAIFSAVEQIVASNIVFIGMTYTHLPNNRFSIALTGLADDFNQVLRQRELMQESSLLKGIEILEFDYSVTGSEESTTVAGQPVLTFIFSDTRDISLIPYTANTTDASNFNNTVGGGSATSSIEVLSEGPTTDTNEEDSEVDTGEVDEEASVEVVGEATGTSTAE